MQINGFNPSFSPFQKQSERLEFGRPNRIGVNYGFPEAAAEDAPAQEVVESIPPSHQALEQVARTREFVAIAIDETRRAIQVLEQRLKAAHHEHDTLSNIMARLSN